jgi:putative nucleotidyltransferase with HDIG domain
MSDRNLQGVVNRIKNLPTLPHIIPHLMRVLDNPNATAAEVGKVISSDQALMTKILKLVNSAMYGLPRRVSTLSQATAILGFNAVRSTAIAATVFQNLGHGSFNRMKLWEHALGCAVSSKIIARRTGYQNAEEAFIAGLVHDIGKMIIDQFLNEDFLKICAQVEQDGMRMLDAELAVLGVGHPHIGGWLARKWNLPNTLVNTIVYHHEPQLAGADSKLVSIVNIGDALTRLARIGSGGDIQPPQIHPTVWPQLNLQEAEVPELIEEISIDYANSSDFLNVLRE